jgi:regulator of sigma E protease
MNWILIFLGFCLLIILHEAGHFVAAKATGMRVERFFLFFGPTLWSVKKGETEYGVKAIPLGGYVKITGMNPEEEVPPEHEAKAYYKQKVWKRIVVVAAGPAVNIVLAFLILVAVRASLGSPEVSQTVEAIRPGSPAAKVLQPGDRVVAIDGQRFPGLDARERLERFGDIVTSHGCADGAKTQGCVAQTPVKLTVEHGGQTRTIAVRPEYDSKEGRALIGFSYGSEQVDVGIATAASQAGDAIWEVAKGTVDVFSHLFEEQKREQVSGVVGISDAANETLEGEQALERGLLLLALVSLSLGLVNLIPILPLDGGHIFWAIVEKLRRGKPVPLRVMERATVIGIVLVLGIFFLGLSNDIGRITGEGFSAR